MAKPRVDAIVKGNLVMHSHGGEDIAILTDTKANILATTGTAGQLAFSTDTLEFYAHDGTNWNVAPIRHSPVEDQYDVGAPLVNSRQGYGALYLTDKNLSNVAIKSGQRVDEGVLKTSSGAFYIYLNGAWNEIVINFRFRENEDNYYVLEHRPIGFELWYEVGSGDSVLKDANGKPLIQNHQSTVGAYTAPLVICGGTF